MPIFHTSVKTCAAEDIQYAERSPNQTEYDYNTNVVYSCDVGFERASGDLTRTCQADRSWSGTAPSCSCMSVVFTVKSTLH